MIELANGTLFGSSSPSSTRTKSSASPICFFSTVEDLKPYSSLNITEPYSESEISNAKYLEFVIYPILLAISTFGNGLCLFVLAHEQPKTSTSVYMMTVAISDLIVMWLTLPTYQYTAYFYLQYTSKARRKELRNLSGAYFNYKGLNNYLQETAIQVSDWILFVFSVERLYVILQPFKSRGMLTAKSAWIKCGVVAFLSGLMILHNIVWYYYLYDPETTYTAKPPWPCWLSDWKVIQDRAEVTIFFIKFFILFVVNMAVIAAISRHAMTQGVNQTKESRRNYANSNLLLLGSVALYLVAQLPAVVDNFLRMTSQTNPYIYPDSTKKFALPFIAMCFLINYSANCFVYLFISKRFRAQLFTVCEQYGFKINRMKPIRGGATASFSPDRTETEISNGIELDQK